LFLLLPIAVLGLLWHLTSHNRKALGLSRLSRRGALLVAYLVWQSLLLIVTELSSIDGHFTRGVLVASWGGLLVVLIAAAWADIRRLATNVRTGLHPTAAARRLFDRLGAESVAWLVIVALIVGILGYLGWSFLPSNGDSLVYHLVRVAHWIQDRSISPFPTQYLAQIELSPLAEYNLAHFHLLAGTDRFDGYMQLLACIICLVAVSEVARLLGGSRWTQVVSVVICATIPSGILVATSTENDYFAAAIGICTVVVALAWPSQGNWWVPSLLVGMGAGLAYMAKGTVPLLMGPAIIFILLVPLVRAIRQQGFTASAKRWGGTVLVSVLAVIAVVAPFMAQNVSLFGSVVGPVSRSTQSTNLTPAAAAANVVRSTAADFMIGNGKSGVETRISEEALGHLHHVFLWFHIDPNDQNYVLGTATDAFAKSDYSAWDRSGDSSADPWDVVLIVASVPILVVASLRRRRGARTTLLLAAGLIVGYLLFTGTSRWSVFNVRYQLPLFVAWSAVIAVALSWLPKMATRIVLVFLVLACIPQLFDNVEEPFSHRDYAAHSLSPYFLDTIVQNYVVVSNAEYSSVSQEIASSSCHRVGLANWVFVEYPLWVGLQYADWHGEMQDVDVENVSSRFENPAFKPCVLLRQEMAGYVGADDADVHLQFGTLALSIDPQDAQSLRRPVRGFDSSVSGVRLLPGGGWSLGGGGSGMPHLAQSGSVFLFSPTRRTVQLQLRSGSKTAPTPVVVSAPRSGLPPTAVSPNTDVSLVVSPGITEVRLGTAAGSATSSDIDGVVVH
jgi:hypothetical protein